MNLVFIFSAQYLVFFEIAAAAVYFFTQAGAVRRSMMIVSAVFLPIAYGAAKLSSLFFYNPRPFVSDGAVPLLAHAADNGFPSDHMLLATAVAAIVFMFNKKIGAGLFAVALIVGAGRVFVGVHHWIDVAGSAGIALAVMAVAKRYLFPRAERLEIRIRTRIGS